MCCAKKIMPPTPCRLCLPWNRMFLDSRDLGPHPKLGLRVYVEPSTGGPVQAVGHVVWIPFGGSFDPFWGVKTCHFGHVALGPGGTPFRGPNPRAFLGLWGKE